MKKVQVETTAKHRWRDMLRTDCVVLATLAVGIVAVSIHRSKTHLLWPDEVLGYRLFAAPTVKGMLRGWYAGADGGGLLYYLFARLWTMLFGLSELTLRLFSTLGMLISVLIIWLSGRCFATPLIVAVAMSVVYLIPVEFLWQASDGRFYGMFLASAALCSLLFLIAAENRTTPLLLLWTALAHTLLVGSHILGVVYSGFLVLGMFFVGRPRERLPLAGAAAIAWILVPLSWHAAKASASIAVRPFAVPPPALDDLVTGPALSDPLATGILASLLALFLVSRFGTSRQDGEPLMPHSAKVLLLCLFGAMAALFVKSQIGVPVFRERYLFPVTIGTTLLLIFLLKRILPVPWSKPLGAVSTVSFCLCVMVPPLVFSAFRSMKEDIYPPSSFIRDASALPETPVVVTHFPAYTVLSHYDSRHRYLYMVNWQYDLAPGRLPADYSSERLMENIRRGGLDEQSLVACHDIFARYPDFTLLTEPRRQTWMMSQLLHNPAYKVEQLTGFQPWRTATAWSVHRLHLGQSPC